MVYHVPQQIHPNSIIFKVNYEKGRPDRIKTEIYFERFYYFKENWKKKYCEKCGATVKGTNQICTWCQ